MLTKQKKYDLAYMKMATEWSHFHIANEKSRSTNVKDNMIISDGYNGTPSGFENIVRLEGETKWYVLHAEANAILKCAKHGQSCKGADLYLTLSPCKECSKLIHQAGIKRVIYSKEYKDTSGIQFLKKAGVQIIQLKHENKKDGQYSILAICIAVIALYFVNWTNNNTYKYGTKLDQILNEVQTNYVDSIDMSSLIESSIEQTLKHLDPHSVYMTKDQVLSSMEMMQGSFEGIE